MRTHRTDCPDLPNMPDDNVSTALLSYDKDAFFGSLVCNDTKNRDYAYNYDQHYQQYDTYSYEDSYHLYVKLSDAENALFLIFCLLIITGNLTVMIWRCSRRREERNSIPSLLVINLAAADLLLGIQLVIFLCMYSWSCSALNSPNSVQIKLMTSLCYVSGVMESTSILISGIINGIIAFYYANVMFGERCCCCIKRTCVIVSLCTGWIVVVVLGVGATMFPLSQDNTTPFLNKTVSLFYMAANLPVHTSDSLTNNSVPNITISMVQIAHCIPITSFVGDFTAVIFNGAVAGIAGIIFGIDFLFIAAAAGIYIAIAVKLRRSRASVNSNSLGGLDFRLVAIAIVTFFGWAAFFIIPFLPQLNYTYVEILLPLAIVALSNPLTFTLTSVPFCKTVKKLKRFIFFKLNRPVPIEDITDDEERLIATKSPSDSTMKDYSSLAESD